MDASYGQAVLRAVRMIIDEDESMGALVEALSWKVLI